MSSASNFVISYKSDRFDDFDFGIEKVGTSVQIIDFNNLPNGLLGITVKAFTVIPNNPFGKLLKSMICTDVPTFSIPKSKSSNLSDL